MNHFKKIVPIILLGVLIGVGAYTIGQSQGKKDVTGTTQAALYNATPLTNDWWPAGDGFCYHKLRTQWGSYWVLGEISRGRCVDILLKDHMDNLEVLIKQGGIQAKQITK